jgi:hypothetical protein
MLSGWVTSTILCTILVRHTIVRVSSSINVVVAARVTYTIEEKHPRLGTVIRSARRSVAVADPYAVGSIEMARSRSRGRSIDSRCW